MNPADVASTLEVLGAFAKILDGLGVQGLVGLCLSGPALVLIAVMVIEYRRSRETHGMVDRMREECHTLIAAYREDTQHILREMDKKQSKTDEYYRANVELVKKCSHIAEQQQDVIIMNTRSMERLVTILETRGKPL